MNAFCSACGHALLEGGRFCSGLRHAGELGLRLLRWRARGERRLLPALRAGVRSSSRGSRRPSPASRSPPAASRACCSATWSASRRSRRPATRRRCASCSRRYFDECRQIIARYGGTVEKFIGDAVMAVWGVPTAHEDDAERAVRAGLELVNVVADHGRGRGRRRPGDARRHRHRRGRGDHRGRAAGHGRRRRGQHRRPRPVGGAPGQVWVDETTRLLTAVRDHLRRRGQPPAQGQGRSGAAVVGACGGRRRGRRAARGRPRGAARRPRARAAPGQGGCSTASRRPGRPALLVMVGDAGVGKSRLGVGVREVRRRSPRSRSRWHSGRCVAYGEGVAFFALAEAVRARLRALAAGPVGRPGRPGAHDPARLLDVGLDRYVRGRGGAGLAAARLGALLGIGSVGRLPARGPVLGVDGLPRAGGGGPDPVVAASSTTPSTRTTGCSSSSSTCSTWPAFPCFVVLLTRPGLLEDAPDAGHQLGAPRSATSRRCRTPTWPPSSTGSSPGCPSVREALVGALRGSAALRRGDGPLAHRPRPGGPAGWSVRARRSPSASTSTRSVRLRRCRR